MRRKPIAESFSLAGKVALVTGANSGIGREIAFAFADAGAAVVLVARRIAELDATRKSIEAAGIQIVGISYDGTKALKTFSDRMTMGFPMLSDPGSATIDAYHIRNKAARGRAEGVPNPGTFILDQHGVIRAKLFLDAHESVEPRAQIVHQHPSLA